MAADIARASTLPGRFYTDPTLLDASRERIFSRSWQLVGDVGRLKAPGQVLPITMLEGFLDEPLVLVRDGEDHLHALSNVCTHRGNRVVESEGVERGLRCRYHGRRFALDGRCLSMPEFEGVEGFPAPSDDLPRVRLERWGKLLFASLDPAVEFDAWIGETRERLAWLPHDDLTLDPVRSRDYVVRAHWALYCDNYLEGFHIPYVHAGLSQALDYGAYRTELFPWSVLQVGVAEGGDAVLDLPASSPDHGQSIAGYYFWLFPNTMVNVYPWGLSINVVRPLAVDRTRISYITYVMDPSRLDRGAGAALDRVEREDEAIIERVQEGVRSRLYHRGRFSPTREQGVPRFHRLLTSSLGDHDAL